MILLAGPWLGEFGWELMMWHAHVRFLSHKYERTICVTRTGHGVLYNDFADEIYHYDVEGQRNGWRLDGATPRIPSEIINKVNKRSDLFILHPKKIDFRKQEFIKFSRDSHVKYDLVFCCRSTNKLNTGYRNWESNKWVELRDLFSNLRIACVGSESESISIPGADDLRGISLDLLIGIISNAKVVIGPSSGPMHLASLCGTTHVVFTDKEKIFDGENNRYRYEYAWNPHNTRVIVIDEYGWKPPVDIVAQHINEVLNNTI